MDLSLETSPIVVGIDDSPGSRAALAWAVDEATRRSAALLLVHAWRPMYHAHVDDYTYGNLGVAFQSHGQNVLGAALGRVHAVAPHVDVRGRLVKGSPSAVLLDASDQAEILVIGSRGMGGFTGLLLGSVGLHLVAHARCPVVVVRGVRRQNGPVVVGIDESPDADAVLHNAFELASLRQAPLVAMWAVHVQVPMGGEVGEEEARVAVEARVGDVVEELVTNWARKYPDVKVSMTSPTGHPAEALVNASRSAQLLVVGSHGGGGFTGMALGSTTHAVVHHARCPVMVVRAGR